MQLQIENVVKDYKGGVRALAGISLTLGPGMTGLLGPNGAGKTTLMRILATIARPTSGRVLWNGVDIASSPEPLRAVLGYLPQDFGVYPNLNALEFLEYMAAAKGLSGAATLRRIEALLDALHLTEVRQRPLSTFSSGMKQRLGVAQALLGDPQLLIVDEPTAGLDPEERVSLRHLLSELATDRIVLLSTHIVSDVEATAAEIALIAGGRLVEHGDAEQLIRAVEGKVWEWTVPAAEVEAVRARFRVSGAVRRGNGVELRILSPNCPGAEARSVPPTLEDAYLQFVAEHRAQR